jgi:hypothetical protein
MGRVARGDAKTKLALIASAAAVVAGLLAPATSQATRTVTPASLDFGTIKNGAAGGRASASVVYAISADELGRYAYTRAGGGASDASTQFSIGGGDCYSVFPPAPQVPASCTTVIQFDYSRAARGISTGTLVIDGDTDFETTSDQIVVPLRANLDPWAKKKACKKHRRESAAAKKRKCRKKR